MDNRKSAYTLGSLPIGFSYVGYVLGRYTKLQAFSAGIADLFNATILSNALVLTFICALALIKFLIGLLLLLVFSISKLPTAGVALIGFLFFGFSFQKNWVTDCTPQFYGIYFSMLHLFNNENKYSLSK